MGALVVGIDHFSYPQTSLRESNGPYDGLINLLKLSRERSLGLKGSARRWKCPAVCLWMVQVS